ncbi:hypothetical protein SETIT_5G252500v2 [Setaria italica]|uniref:KIB1-4 beta-propeller domain-containing protein n=1 Tax=Setaria italica TaxID=4555 RepID=A0A368R8W7_SETIT|nr:hypothetical protein SETIT_5G252500v2 [Setaria italica]
MAPPHQLLWLILPSLVMASSFAHQTGCTRRLRLPEGIRRHPMLICTVIFSDAPTSPNCLAAAHVASTCNIEFYRPGMDAHWEPSVIEDIIYRRSLVEQSFYVLTNIEDLLVYSIISATNTPLEMTCVECMFEKRMDYNINKPGFSASHYLVESRGKLLMVLREYSIRSVKRFTRMSMIFEMVDALPHGQGKASLVSQFTEVQEGFIYYLYDTSFDISLVMSSGGKFSSSNMGVYAMAMNKRMSRGGARCFLCGFTSECSPPLWPLN